MLLELAQWLAKDVRLFNVFNYITLRAVLACLTALAVSLILGPYFIRKLTAYKIGQAVRDDGPRSHLTKAGTPTMGGALILVSICVTTLLWGDLSNKLLWVVLLVTLAFGTIVFAVFSTGRILPYTSAGAIKRCWNFCMPRASGCQSLFRFSIS